MKKRKILAILFAGLSLMMLIAGCTKSTDVAKTDLNKLSLDQIIEQAKKEGRVDSVGMPDEWANWKDTWKDLKSKYGIDHKDVDMSSAEELAVFESEKNNATKDIGDVGQGKG